MNGCHQFIQVTKPHHCIYMQQSTQMGSTFRFACNFHCICNASARQTRYQQVSGGLHTVSRSGLEGHIAAELAGMQALQEEALLLQHWSAVQVVQLVSHPHNVLPAPQHPCSGNVIACRLYQKLPWVLDIGFLCGA